MRRTTLAQALVSALALVALPTIAAADPPPNAGRPITVEMTGAAERPGPGDPDGSGIAHVRLNPGQERICYTLDVSDIAPATAAHIHVAGPDQPGPVVVPLDPPTSGTAAGCVTVDRELVLDIVRDPSGYYVNVHNADFPAGAVRGQLG
ncbi:CHRD domain-containing protein [Georgenia sp. H159]|uniref:CHRD domain-containing protein n=1 Tax=Georgenia sp. H159 TaxID=3076115 RepID=UPI002D79D9C1|nr:CHRD domain-containing protein [Georgenia sp. H159]